MNRIFFIFSLIFLSGCAGFLYPAFSSATQNTGHSVSEGRYSVIIKNDPFDVKRGAGDISQSDGGQGSGSGGITENYILYGIIRSGGVRKAYLKPKKSAGRKSIRTGGKKKSHDSYRTVTEGDLIDGWKVEKITSRGIVVASGSQKTTIPVFSGNKTGRKSNRPVALLTKSPAPQQVTPAESHSTRNAAQNASGATGATTPALIKKGIASNKNNKKKTKLPIFGGSTMVRPPGSTSSPKAAKGINIFQQLLQKSSGGNAAQNPFANK